MPEIFEDATVPLNEYLAANAWASRAPIEARRTAAEKSVLRIFIPAPTAKVPKSIVTEPPQVSFFRSPRLHSAHGSSRLAWLADLPVPCLCTHRRRDVGAKQCTMAAGRALR